MAWVLLKAAVTVTLAAGMVKVYLPLPLSVTLTVSPPAVLTVTPLTA